MVPGTTVARTQKQAYRPHIRIVNADQGLYTVQSQVYTHVLYLVDTVHGTCECEAGRRGFKGVKAHGGVCKHLFIARQYHTHRQHNLLAAPAATQAQVSLQAVAA